MRKYAKLLFAIVAIANQVALPSGIIATTRVASAKSAEAAQGQSSHNIRFASAADPLQVVSTKPSWDEAVLTPLRAKQAEEAAAEAAKAREATRVRRARAAQTATSNTHLTIASGDVWEALRICEAGGDYTRNSGNGYFGAYQFDIGTWGGYGGYARADLAPPAVQDAKAQATQAARGWYPWPTCSRKLGLL